VLDTIAAGDQVLLTLEDGKTFLLVMEPGRHHSTHRGSIDHDAVIGQLWGAALTLSTGKEVYLLRPRWIDRMMKVHRRTNIMYPKDVAYLLAALDVGPGKTVIEIGCGSGAMTQALTRAVSPGGRVFSYDKREEFLELNARNCAAARIDCSLVTYAVREAGETLQEGADAVFCDVPEPWAELGVIEAALAGSGRFAAGIPTFNQAERLASALVGHGFAMVETLEILVRGILARPGRTRPEHRMIGHTQLLTTAVKVMRSPRGAE